MMKDNIFSICLGNNSYNLNGCKNDSIIFFNYIYKLYKNKSIKENWLKPYILFNEKVAVSNIIDLISNCKERIDKILFFYSGHGYFKDKININSLDNTSKSITSSELINNINSVLKNDINLYIILDSCYSGSFQIVPYDKIKKINLISSTSSTQKSTESIIKKKDFYNKELINDITIDKNNITVGTFTFHFVNLLNQLNIDDIDNFKLVFFDKDCSNVWISIGIIGNHFPKILW